MQLVVDYVESAEPGLEKPGFLSDGCHFVPFALALVGAGGGNSTKTVLQGAARLLNERAAQRRLEFVYSEELLLEKLLLPISLNLTSKRLVPGVQES